MERMQHSVISDCVLDTFSLFRLSFTLCPVYF
jgi:hypothetical protein